jgi:16S rRNA (cytidine1402-2'-O)-methyltransferase
MAKLSKSIKPGLYVTATPIGNLGDITYRAVETMKAADLILCEDTRQTSKLCAAYDIKTPRRPYHDHNAQKVRPEILDRLQHGETICLVSDAGTPLIADPGYKLVREARNVDVDVFPLPGPSAFAAALSAAGAPTDRFTFEGFPPAKGTARRKLLTRIQDVEGTIVFYETGPRLADSLAAMAETFGAERRAVVARELTKIHEEFRDGDLASLSAHYKAAPAKGEIVILIFPAAETETKAEDIETFLRSALKDMTVKDAARAAAETLGVSRKDAYDRAVALKGD